MPATGKKTFIGRHSLSLALFALFLLSWTGLGLTGWKTMNEEADQNVRPRVTLVGYVQSAEFWSATLENWESEFLQMAVYVLLTVSLREEGSAESKSCDEEDDADEGKYPRRYFRDSPALRWLYERSLSFALFVLFLGSFAGHARFSWIQHSRENAAAGGSPETFLEFLGTSRLWFESFQNWQSEFLSVAVLVILTIYLRQRGSAQSKPVDAPHSANE